VVVGELLGQFQQPQGFQAAAGFWGVRQLFAVPVDVAQNLDFSVTAQFDALIDAQLNCEYAHVDRVRS